MNQHDKQIEQDLMGVLLLYPHRILSAAQILKPEYMYCHEPRAVYNAILGLYKNGDPIDVGTVVHELKRSNQLDMVGGPYYVSSLTRTGDIKETILEFNCYLIHELYILRELSVLGTEISNAALTAKADCFEIIDRINKRTSELTDIRAERIKTAGDFFDELVKENNDVIENNAPTGLMSGLENLDRRTGGWQPGNLIILAARPGMGKTAFGLALAKYPAIELNKPVAFFSLEMSGIELAGRLASSESLINSTDINQKKLDRLQLNTMTQRCSKLSGAPLYIDDTPGLTITELRNKAKKLFYEHKVELIVVDYLQKMHGSKRANRDQEISEISGGLKDLARELNIPVIALAQLNREVESRPDKRPILKDLRDGGSIEQDADLVAFLFRPEYYDLFENGYEFKNEVLPVQNLLLCDMAKGRGLKIGEIALKFYGEHMRITSYPLSNNTSMLDNTEFLKPII